MIMFASIEHVKFSYKYIYIQYILKTFNCTLRKMVFSVGIESDLISFIFVVPGQAVNHENTKGKLLVFATDTGGPI